MGFLTAALNAHLNIGQNLSMSSSSMFVSLQTQTLESISNKVIQQPGRGIIRIPANLTSTVSNNQTISLRVRLILFFRDLRNDFLLVNDGTFGYC